MSICTKTLLSGSSQKRVRERVHVRREASGSRTGAAWKQGWREKEGETPKLGDQTPGKERREGGGALPLQTSPTIRTTVQAQNSALLESVSGGWVLAIGQCERWRRSLSLARFVAPHP